jgi:putative SOS response-associated peptidase YedK
MCSNFTPAKREVLPAHFGVEPPAADWKEEAYPGYFAPIIRAADDGSAALESVAACFGMVPHWAELTLSRHTYNARSETAASKPSFRHAWSRRQRCIVPAESLFEPSYETGAALRWRIARDDGAPLAIAGLWEWRPNGGPDDKPLMSFTMLTINADAHPLMRRFHRPEDEKRMVVLLREDQYLPWLQSGAGDLIDFLQPWPADRMTAEPAPRAPARRQARPAKPQPPRAVPKTLWDE